jgi:hypothetical protein
MKHISDIIERLVKMPIRSDDKLPNSDIITEDSYYNVNTDIMLLVDRLRIAKKKMSNTKWYSIWTRMELRKEISCIEKEAKEAGERLLRLDEESRNHIKLVKRV